MAGTRQRASADEEAEYRKAAGAGVRQKATPEEVAEANVKPAPTPESAPSLGRSIAEGLMQGGSYGFHDELQGGLGALNEINAKALRPLGLAPEVGPDESIYGAPSVVDAYGSERNAARKDRDAAKAAHPTAYGASELLGAMLAPGPKAGKTVGGFAKAGAKAGGLFALGSSDADLTAGDIPKAALDTLIGTGLGAGGGVFAGLLAKPLQAGAEKLADFGQRAYQRGAEKATKPIDAAINSARGTLGGEVAAGSRGIEVAEKAAADPSLPEDVSRSASDALGDPGIKALAERVARAQIGGLHGRLPRIERAQDAFDSAVEAGSPEARATAVSAFMDKSPMKRAAWEIVKRIAPTLMGAGVGGALGGNAGAGVGGTLGLLTGAMSGAPGRIVKNAATSPQFQRSAAQAGVRALDEIAPGAMRGLIGEQAGKPQSTARETLAPYLELLKEDKKP